METRTNEQIAKARRLEAKAQDALGKRNDSGSADPVPQGGSGESFHPGSDEPEL